MPRMDLGLLEPGQTLCERDVALTRERVGAYVDAVGGDAEFYRRLGAAPPTAVAALALAAAMEAVELPAGTVHTGQELAFTSPAPIGSQLRCVATVASNSVRRGARFLSLDLRALDATGAVVVEGRTSLVVAEEGSA